MIEESCRTHNSTMRIEWLDIAKGLGVVLVLIGHLWYKCVFPIVNHIIYSFHMPLFFVLSGFVYKKGNAKFGSFVMAKIKRLLLPTFLFFVLGSILLILINESFITILTKFFFIEGLCPYNDPCWYFIALFQLLIISFFLNLDKLSLALKFLVASVAFILGYIIYKLNIFLPFGIDRTIIALTFFAFGAILRHAYNKNYKIQKNIIQVFIYISLFLTWFFSGVVFNKKISFYQMDVGNFFHFIISGLCGTGLIIGLSKLLQKTKVLKRFLTKTADNSILIVGTHYFAVDIFETFMGLFNMHGTWQYSLIVLCFAFVLVLIYNHIGTFLNKYFPVIMGKLR